MKLEKFVVEYDAEAAMPMQLLASFVSVVDRFRDKGMKCAEIRVAFEFVMHFRTDPPQCEKGES